jgi:ABC-type polysaccharide transport system, permease component
MHKQTLARDLQQNKWLYLMFIPVAVWFVLFAYVPMAGMVIAFQKYNVFAGVLRSPWVGLQNFERFFHDPYFFRLLRNTVLMNVYGLLWGFPIPISMALAFNEIKNKHVSKVVQTISYLPYFLSTVVVVSIAVQFLSPSTGIINAVLNRLGWESIYFLQKPEYFRTILISMGIWQGSGFAAIIYVAALAGIEQEQYEAAVLDGASKMRQLLSITIPGIAPTIIVMLILNIGSLLSVGHERIILMYNPFIYETADVLNTYVYRMGMVNTDYSFGQAVSLFQNIVGFALVLVANKISTRFSEASLW